MYILRLLLNIHFELQLFLSKPTRHFNSLCDDIRRYV